MCAGEHLIGLQTADAGQHGGYFQTSFITSFQHQLQNGVGKIDGRRGLVNMRDWNDTQTVLFVVVGVMVHIQKRHARGFTGSTLIPIKRILTCMHFCLSAVFILKRLQMCIWQRIKNKWIKNQHLPSYVYVTGAVPVQNMMFVTDNPVKWEVYRADRGLSSWTAHRLTDQTCLISRFFF